MVTIATRCYAQNVDWVICFNMWKFHDDQLNSFRDIQFWNFPEKWETGPLNPDTSIKEKGSWVKFDSMDSKGLTFENKNVIGCNFG